MDTNVSHTVPPADVPQLLAQAQPFDDELEPFRPPDPPAVEGVCSRCGWRGHVYAGRYGGHRWPVCFGLQNGWMPRS